MLVEITDTASVNFKAILAKTQLLNQPLKECAIISKQEVEKRFNYEVSPKGLRWSENHPIYARLCKPPRAKILSNKGNLRKTVTMSVRGNVLTQSSDLLYSSTHQCGRVAHNISIPKQGGGFLFFKKLNIPARPFVGYSVGEIKQFGDIIIRYLIQ